MCWVPRKGASCEKQDVRDFLYESGRGFCGHQKGTSEGSSLYGDCVYSLGRFSALPHSDFEDLDEVGHLSSSAVIESKTKGLRHQIQNAFRICAEMSKMKDGSGCKIWSSRYIFLCQFHKLMLLLVRQVYKFLTILRSPSQRCMSSLRFDAR